MTSLRLPPVRVAASGIPVASVIVHFNSGGEFTSTDYFLTHPDRSQDLVLASDDRKHAMYAWCRARHRHPPGAQAEAEQW
ncbi:hypothetical protein ABZ589_11740 [Streptomyces sp. NPDC013313]|uniref:hypothetical protein n=1 Tax=Streptomyces sp. NPDC013313 TaxID=3155603 RepID=UPI0033D52975